MRWLHGDACSGILFILRGSVSIDGISYSEPVVLLPVSSCAHSIELNPGTEAAGIRFHPGVGRSFFGDEGDLDDDLFNLPNLCQRLCGATGQGAQVNTIYRWLNREVSFGGKIPSSLKIAIDAIEQTNNLNQVPRHLRLSQRQFERKFKSWTGLTPVHYKRVMRVKRSRQQLKVNPKLDLAELALSNGFSDQSHLTREFKRIARITPGQYSKRVSAKKAV